MSKSKGRRQPLHSEITDLRPSRKKAKAASGAAAVEAVEATEPETADAETASLETTDAGAADAETPDAETPDAEAGPEASEGAEAPMADLEATDAEAMAGHDHAAPLDGASEDASPASERGDDLGGNGALPEELDSASPLDDSLFDSGEDDDRPRDEEARSRGNVIPIDGSEPDETEAYLSGLIEALLFTSQRPLALKEIARAAGIDRPRARELLEHLSRSYARRGICIDEVAGGFALRSSPRYAPQIQKFLSLRPVRLSRAQLETLAIVAYRQPVTKPEVDDIRGVDSGQVLKGLMERSLLKILGKKDEPGRPMLYGTTNDFLELLNLRALSELPTLREYTELSDESRAKFAEETGEEVPAGGLPPSPAADADPAPDPAASGTTAAQPEWSAAELENDPADPEAEPTAEEAGEDVAHAGKRTEEDEDPSDDDDTDEDDDDADEDDDDADEDDDDTDEDDDDTDEDDDDTDEDDDDADEDDDDDADEDDDDADEDDDDADEEK